MKESKINEGAASNKGMSMNSSSRSSSSSRRNISDNIFSSNTMPISMPMPMPLPIPIPTMPISAPTISMESSVEPLPMAVTSSLSSVEPLPMAVTSSLSSRMVPIETKIAKTAASVPILSSSVIQFPPQPVTIGLSMKRNYSNISNSSLYSTGEMSISSSSSMPSSVETVPSSFHYLSSPSPSAATPARRHGHKRTPIRRTRSLSTNSWNRHFQELIRFREKNDHCFVPHHHPENPKLSQWVRKQRHQRKRKDKGFHSTLSDERQEMLTNAGFIWDSHKAQWQERYQSLEMYQFANGHCNVPSDYHDSSLSNWVKNQRRQYRLHQTGHKNTLDQERVDLLNSIGFNWNPRNLGANGEKVVTRKQNK